MGSGSSIAQAERGWICQATATAGTANEEDAPGRCDYHGRGQPSGKLGERCEGQGEEGGDEQEAREGFDDRYGELDNQSSMAIYAELIGRRQSI